MLCVDDVLDSCFLFIVRCLLSVVPRVLLLFVFVVCFFCGLFDDGVFCSLFVLRRLLLVVCCLLCVMRYSLFVVRCVLFVAHCSLCVVRCFGVCSSLLFFC